jgi:hypothetical protein
VVEKAKIEEGQEKREVSVPDGEDDGSSSTHQMFYLVLTWRVRVGGYGPSMDVVSLVSPSILLITSRFRVLGLLGTYISPASA